VILVISTSSPLVSVAVVNAAGAVQGEAGALANGRASESVLGLAEQVLTTLDLGWDALEGVVADVGPGGFTGTRVGVTVAKTLAWAQGWSVGAIGAHDLIAREAVVAVPVRRDRWRVRLVDGTEADAEAWPEGARGYGHVGSPEYPHAHRISDVWERVRWVAPEALVPAYGVAPSISLPKRPYGGGVA